MGEEFNKKLNEIHTSIAVIKTDMKYIRKEIEGNGKKGLIKKVEELETDNDKFKGGLLLFKFLLSFIGLGNLIMLFKMFVK